MNKKLTKSYEFMLFCVIAILTVVLALATGGKSIAPTNLLDLVTSYSAYGVIAIGCLFVIISGGIDISFMAVGAVAQYLAALYMLNVGGNLFVVLLISVVTGVLLGLVNAVLVNRLRVPTLIITIATMNIIYGITMRITSGVRLHGFPKWFADKSSPRLFLFTVGVLAVMLVLAALILKKTKIGRKIYAVGGNTEAAKRCGINVLAVQLFVYGFAGAMAGIGALIKCYLSQQASIGALIKCYLSQQASIGALYGNEMDVLAMVVLGGVALEGGKGSVLGTFFGILLVAILSNGMILMGVSSYWKDLVIGAVIMVSFCITGWRVLSRRARERRGETVE